MNLNEAIGHASTLFMPEFLFGMDDDLLEGERAINEEALHLLIEEYFSNPNPSFGFDLVLDLADRNRSISDMMPPETVGGDRSRSRNLPSGLSDADILRGIATMQHRRVETLEKEAAGIFVSAAHRARHGKDQLAPGIRMVKAVHDRRLAVRQGEPCEKRLVHVRGAIGEKRLHAVRRMRGGKMRCVLSRICIRTVRPPQRLEIRADRVLAPSAGNSSVATIGKWSLG